MAFSGPDLPGLDALLEEEAAVTWATWRWRAAPLPAHCQGIAWVRREEVLGYQMVQFCQGVAVLGRSFVTRRERPGPLETAFYTTVVETCLRMPTVDRVFGEMAWADGTTLATFQARWPGRVRIRILQETTRPAPSLPDPEGVAFAPWKREEAGATGNLLHRTYSLIPDPLANPAFFNPEGMGLLVGAMVDHPVVGEFEPTASFSARDAATGDLLGILLATRMGGIQGHIAEVAVDPSCQGRGLGRALMVRGLRSLEALGCRATNLVVNEDNTRAFNLYQSLGFNELHRFPDLRLRKGAPGIPSATA
jgi:ribosomal protein S18 acetylase RimI-like enzyme